MAEFNRELINQYIEAEGNSLLTTPVQIHVPRPTDKDYKFGEIKRYFVQKVNDPKSPVYEVTKTNFSALRKSPLYITMEVRWQISGPLDDEYDDRGVRIQTGVITANKATAQRASKSMPGIGGKLSNPLQLYKRE